ncbi:ParA family protein [Streptomyces sp. NPDC056224]|uniref:ParA family protein n=1 Tax=Streptomyces sp. NPDC056224 TaxID=3345750 RepID=UPI0035D90FB6
MGKRIASYSEKGGVGKSAAAAGMVAAARKRRLDGAAGSVFAADLDPRGTLTAELGINMPPPFTMNDLLAMDPKGERGLAAEALTDASDDWSGVRVIAAERALANREADQSTGFEFRLRHALDGILGEDDDLIFDLPPRAGGKLVTAALLAATHVVIPATLNEDGRIGAEEAMETIEIIRDSYGHDIQVVAIVPSIVPGGRTTLADAIGKHLAATYGDLYRDDLAIPRHTLREQTRYACVPVTSQSGKEAAALTTAYDRILTAAGATK